MHFCFWCCHVKHNAADSLNTNRATQILSFYCDSDCECVLCVLSVSTHCFCEYIFYRRIYEQNEKDERTNKATTIGQCIDRG